jgi:hypothetical protein
LKYNKTCPNNCGNNKGIFKKDYIYCPYCKEELISKTIVSKNSGKYCTKKKCEYYIHNLGMPYCRKYVCIDTNNYLDIHKRSLCGEFRETVILKGAI